MSAADTSEIRDTREPPFGFWWRSYAMLVKEFIQLRRDRVSFAMIVMIPVMQLLLFGYAINTTPRHLPTAVLMQEESDLAPLACCVRHTHWKLSLERVIRSIKTSSSDGSLACQCHLVSSR